MRCIFVTVILITAIFRVYAQNAPSNISVKTEDIHKFWTFKKYDLYKFNNHIGSAFSTDIKEKGLDLTRKDTLIMTSFNRKPDTVVYRIAHKTIIATIGKEQMKFRISKLTPNELRLLLPGQEKEKYNLIESIYQIE